MRILIVTQNFYPDVFAVNETVEGLVGCGHDVTVLTGLPDYATSRIPKEYRYGKNRVQELFGAKVYRVPIVARRHGAVFRCLNYASFALNAAFMARFRKWEPFDLVYVWETSPVTMAIPAITLKRRYKTPLLLYCLDIWPECIKAMGFREGTWFYRMVHRLSKRIYGQCDHIAVSSEPFFSYLHDVNGIAWEKMSYLPQFASEDLLKEDLEKTEDGHTDFLYVGNVGKAQDMDCLVRAAARFADRDDVSFHIVGGGSRLDETISLAKETGADRVMTFYGPKPFRETLPFYRKADACLITLDGSTRIGDTLPGKLQTYMAAGKPIIGALNGAGQDVILRSGCGLYAAASDVDGLAGCLEEFIQQKNPDYGNKGRAWFLAHYTREKHLRRLEHLMEKMTGKENTDKNGEAQ